MAARTPGRRRPVAPVLPCRAVSVSLEPRDFLNLLFSSISFYLSSRQNFLSPPSCLWCKTNALYTPSICLNWSKRKRGPGSWNTSSKLLGGELELTHKGQTQIGSNNFCRGEGMYTTQTGRERHPHLFLVSTGRGLTECGMDWGDTRYHVYHAALQFENIIFHPHSSLKRLSHFITSGRMRRWELLPKLLTFPKANEDFIANLQEAPCTARRCPGNKSIRIEQSRPDRRLSASLSSQPLPCLCSLRPLCRLHPAARAPSSQFVSSDTNIPPPTRLKNFIFKEVELRLCLKRTGMLANIHRAALFSTVQSSVSEWFLRPWQCHSAQPWWHRGMHSVAHPLGEMTV